MAVRQRSVQPVQQAPPPPPPMQQAAPVINGYAQQGYAPQAVEGLPFLDLGFYSGGFTLAPGKYVITDFTVRMFKGEKSTQPERLGVLVTFVPLADPREENKKTQFYSMGGSADKSFVPTQDGKGILPIPGAPGQNANNSTNWYLFIRALYDAGLPRGLSVNSLAPLEGIWLETTLIDEPTERASFQSSTAEVQQERVARKIAVPLMVLDGGKPWEGTGGWPDRAVSFPDSPQPVMSQNVAVGVLRPVAAPVQQYNQVAVPVQTVPAPRAAVAEDPDVRMSAMNGIADFLTKNANGASRLMVRSKVFEIVRDKEGEVAAARVITQYFDTPNALESVLADLAYKVNGAMVVPA